MVDTGIPQEAAQDIHVILTYEAMPPFPIFRLFGDSFSLSGGMQIDIS